MQGRFGNGIRRRVAILHAYAHLATHWHRLKIPPEVMAGLPREKQVYFREPWIADFPHFSCNHQHNGTFYG